MIIFQELFRAITFERYQSVMDDKDRRILNEFAARLRQRYPDARIWAYGSRAKGKADWESDFDICIVLDEVSPEGERFIRDIAWELGFENDRVITTLIIDQDRFEHGPMSESSLVANILSEGVSA